MVEIRPTVFVYKTVEEFDGGEKTPGGYFGLIYRNTEEHICYFVISETVDGIPAALAQDHCWSLPEKDFQEIIGGDFDAQVEVFVGTPMPINPQA